MADFPEPSGVCGGWALDLFLDRVTRPHKDVEVAILRSNQLSVQRQLLSRGWKLEVAHKGELRLWERDEFLDPPFHTIWCSREEEAELEFFEVLLNEHEGQHFLFRRFPSVRTNLAEAFQASPAGIPILAPQIVLLYMATEVEASDHEFDLINMLPELDGERQDWLQGALSRIDPQHDWLALLNHWGA